MIAGRAWWCGALALLTACGRLGFDEQAVVGDAARPDACAGTHDEDADGVPDPCDVCPHLADTAQLDGDGDRVGDACDPQPTRARERIVTFDPLLTTDAWTAFGVVEPLADPNGPLRGVRLGGVAQEGSIRRAFVPAQDGATDMLVIGARTFAAGPGQRLLGILFGESAPPQLYYCELFDDGTSGFLQSTYTLDGTEFIHPASIAGPRLENGSGTLAARIDATSLACVLRWNTADAMVSGGYPSEIDAEVLGLYAENVGAELDYFLHIRTDE